MWGHMPHDNRCQIKHFTPRTTKQNKKKLWVNERKNETVVCIVYTENPPETRVLAPSTSMWFFDVYNKISFCQPCVPLFNSSLLKWAKWQATEYYGFCYCCHCCCCCSRCHCCHHYCSCCCCCFFAMYSVLLKTSLRTNMHQNKAQRPKRFFTYGSLVGHFVL